MMTGLDDTPPARRAGWHRPYGRLRSTRPSHGCERASMRSASPAAPLLGGRGVRRAPGPTATRPSRASPAKPCTVDWRTVRAATSSLVPPCWSCQRATARSTSRTRSWQGSAHPTRSRRHPGDPSPWTGVAHRRVPRDRVGRAGAPTREPAVVARPPAGRRPRRRQPRRHLVLGVTLVSPRRARPSRRRPARCRRRRRSR